MERRKVFHGMSRHFPWNVLTFSKKKVPVFRQEIPSPPPPQAFWEGCVFTFIKKQAPDKRKSGKLRLPDPLESAQKDTKNHNITDKKKFHASHGTFPWIRLPDCNIHTGKIRKKPSTRKKIPENSCISQNKSIILWKTSRHLKNRISLNLIKKIILGRWRSFSAAAFFAAHPKVRHWKQTP